MAEPIISVDAFKFVALRPAQLAREKDTAASLIRDERAATGERRHELSMLARSLPHTDVRARSRTSAMWSQWRDGSHTLREKLKFVTEPIDPELMLRELGLPSLEKHETRDLLELAWNDLYATYRRGPDAGSQLDEPLSVLRLLHLQSLASRRMLKSRADVDAALNATPVIAFSHDELRAPVRLRSPASSPEIDSHRAERTAAFRRLMSDIDSTQRLLRLSRSARELSAARVRTAAANRGASDGPSSSPLRTDAIVSNVPLLRSVVAERTSGADLRVLAQIGIPDDAPVPAAVRGLESHLTQLNRNAYALRFEPEFLTLLKQSGNTELLKLIPADSITTIGRHGAHELVKTRYTGDVDVRGRIKPLGIGDLKVVKQTLLAYVPGEVAHIENVLKGESKERKHRTLDRMETMLITSEEETLETQKDTQTTDRFELKREAEKTIKEDMSISTGLTVTGGFGPVTITAQGNFAYSNSRQESNKSSANFAREVVERSVAKIQKKVKSERSTKNMREVEEINSHGVQNSEGPGHITGVYRWVDKKYRAQIYNYGVRMMIEFVVPEPAAYFRVSLNAARTVAVNARPPEPFTDMSGEPLTASDINPTNYQLFAARYNATGITPPPPEYLYVATSFDQNEIQNAHTFSKSVKDIAIPDGYIWDHYCANMSVVYEYNPQFSLQIAGEIHHVLTNSAGRRLATAGAGIYWGGDWEDDPRGIVPVSAVGFDVHAYTVHVEVTCRRTLEHYEGWQLLTFEKIYTAYKALQTEYEQKVAQAQANLGAIAIEGRNPAMNRDIEKRELKRLCLTLLTGKHFNDFDAMVYPKPPSADLPELDVYEALEEGSLVQFFEQAFDWEQITYVFYPYFWGQKSQWLATSNLTDPDPLFGHFLQAGAARVVVPVPMAYKDAVLYFLESGEIWEGGETPRLDDPLFISIHEELRNRTDDLAGATPEGMPWEFTLPTTRVWLQTGPELPVYDV